MKKILFCLGIGVFLGCNPKNDENTGKSSVAETDTSYALGMAIAAGYKNLIDSFDCDFDALAQGFREYSEGKKTKFTVTEAIEKANAVYNKSMEVQSEVYKEEQAAFLAENAKNPGIQITPSGLQYEVLTEGAGAKPGPADTVSVHYRGALSDGTVFDSSYDQGQPIEFPLQGVIKGWTEGIQLMAVGSKYRLFIPAELGYGAQGAADVIPPHSALVFEVELLDILK
jgi:FKBP-type peptidyl-prolyl cis-trans isomerase